MKNSFLCLFFTVPVFFGCAHNPPSQHTKTFDEFLDEYKFTQFVPANQIAEPLSIIRNRNSAQEIVSFPDDCSWETPPNIKSSKTAISSLDQTITSSGGLKAYASDEVLQSLNLGALIGSSSVKNIRVEFIDPYLKVVSRVSAQEAFSGASEACKNAATNENNLVIHQLLGVEGIRFNFVGSNGANVNLDADLSDKANLSGEIRREAEANGSITLNESIYVGFRAFSGQLAPGALNDRVAFTVLEPTEVDSILSRQVE